MALRELLACAGSSRVSSLAAPDVPHTSASYAFSDSHFLVCSASGSQLTVREVCASAELHPGPSEVTWPFRSRILGSPAVFEDVDSDDGDILILVATADRQVTTIRLPHPLAPQHEQRAVTSGTVPPISMLGESLHTGQLSLPPDAAAPTHVRFVNPLLALVVTERHELFFVTTDRSGADAFCVELLTGGGGSASSGRGGGGGGGSGWFFGMVAPRQRAFVVLDVVALGVRRAVALCSDNVVRVVSLEAPFRVEREERLPSHGQDDAEQKEGFLRKQRRGQDDLLIVYTRQGGEIAVWEMRDNGEFATICSIQQPDPDEDVLDAYVGGSLTHKAVLLVITLKPDTQAYSVSSWPLGLGSDAPSLADGCWLQVWSLAETQETLTAGDELVEGLDEHEDDIEAFYLSRIFFPGRFSAAVIDAECVRLQRFLGMVEDAGVGLAETVRHHVAVVLQQSDRSPAQATAQCWLEFLQQTLRTWHRTHSAAFCLFVDVGPAFFPTVLTSAGLSVLRPCTVNENLVSYPFDEEPDDPIMLISRLAVGLPVPLDEDDDVRKLLACSAYFHNLVFPPPNSSADAELDRRIREREIEDEEVQAELESLLIDFEPVPERRQHVMAIVQMLGSIAQPRQALEAVFRRMADVEMPARIPSGCAKPPTWVAELGAASFTQTALTDYRLAKELLVLLLYLRSSGAVMQMPLKTRLFVEREGVATAMRLLRAHAVRAWFAFQTAEVHDDVPELDLLTLDDSLLDVDADTMGAGASMLAAADSAALRSQQACPSLVAKLWPHGDETLSFVDPETLTLDMGHVVDVAKRLVDAKQFGHAQRFVCRASLGVERDGATQDVLAECCLKVGEFEEAKACFLSQIARCSRPDDRLEAHRSAITAFEEHRQAEICLELSYSALSLPELSKANSGTLWTKVFRHALDLKHYDEAFAALTEIPDDDKRLGALHRFVVVLSRGGLVRKLCAYPWLGMRETLVDVLLRKARSSVLADDVNFYAVLYAFSVAHRRFADAAHYMYLYVLRLERELDLSQTESLQKAAHALLAVINALHQCPDEPWVCHEESVGPSSPRKRRSPMVVRLEERDDEIAPITFDDEKQEDEEEEEMMGGAKELNFYDSDMEVEGKDQHGYDNDGNKKKKNKASKVVHVVPLSVLKRKYVLCNAHVALSRQASTRVIPFQTSPAATVEMLVQAGLFATAIDVSTAFGLELGHVFTMLTVKCLRLQMSGDPATVAVVFEDDFDDTQCGKPVIDRAWGMLAHYLRVYDTVDTNFSLHEVVARAILSYDEHLRLPQWLVQSWRGDRSHRKEREDEEDDDGYDDDDKEEDEDDDGKRVGSHAFALRRANVVALLRVMIEHDLLVEAGRLALSFLEEAQRAKEEDDDEEHDVWVPIDCLRQLEARLQRHPDGFDDLVAALRQARQALCVK